MQTSPVQRNIFLFYLARLFRIPFFRLPVLYIYLTQNKGLTPATAFFLLGLQEFLLIFLEIPTWVLADKVSRKLSVWIGYITTSLPFVFLPFVNGIIPITIIFVIKAIGKAFISWADTSLLYDSLLDLGRQKEYKSILNKSKVGLLMVSAICILLWWWIAEFNIDLTVMLPFPLMLIWAIATFCMKEPQTTEKAKKMQEASYLKHTLKTIQHLLTSKSIILWVAIFLLQDAISINMKWFYTPIFEKLHFWLALMWSVTALFYIFKSLAAWIGNKLSYDNPIKNIIIYSFASSVLLIGSWFYFHNYSILPTLALVLMGNQIIGSSVDEFLHERIGSHHRSTAMSSINMIGSLSSTIVLYSFGTIQGYKWINTWVLFLWWIFLLMLRGGLVLRNEE